MAIRIACSSCGKNLQIRDELVGKKVKCPACGAALLTVSAATPAVEISEAPQRALEITVKEKAADDSPEPPPDSDTDSNNPSQATIAQPFNVAQADDESSMSTPSPAGSNSRAARFRVLRLHAKGGLGQVSVALDLELNREVALKEIQKRYADKKDSRARFILEAEITGGLEHPGIVPVYALGADKDGRPFYAMRMIRGESLTEAIDKFHGRVRLQTVPSADSGPVRQAGPCFDSLEFKKILRRLIDVCNALQYAHDRGVIHRDLKPSNIMLGKYGETLVVDWGLAKFLGDDVEAGDIATLDQESTLKPGTGSAGLETIAGSAMGTPAYMSPEQAEGRLDLLGSASDVYSLGATLYCLLTGQSSMEGKDVGTVLKNVKHGNFARPRALQAGIPRSLEAICLKAMALKPKNRYASPRQLAEDMEHWLHDEPVRAWTEPWTVKTRRWVGRHRTLVTASAATILVAVVGLAISTVLLSAANEAERAARKLAQAAQTKALEEKALADQARLQAEREKKQKEEQLFRAEKYLYLGQIKEALNHFQNHDLVATRLALNETRADFRGPEYGYLAKVLGSFARTMYGHANSVTSLVLSGDGKRLYSASSDNNIKVWDADSGIEIFTLRGHASAITSLALSPDGKRLFSGSFGSSIKVWDLAARKDIATLPGHVNGVTSLVTSADGKRLFSAGADNNIKVWDLEGDKEVLTLSGHTKGIRSLALSSDGKRLYSGSYDQTIKGWDVEAGTEIITLAGKKGNLVSNILSLALSADGKRLFAGSTDRFIKVWDLGTGKVTDILRGHTNSVMSLVLSHDGKRLSSGDSDGNIKTWDLESGNEILTLRGHTRGVNSLALSADGKRLFSGSSDKAIKVWDLDAGKETLTLRGHGGWIVGMTLSADGKSLFTGSEDKTIRVWDLETNKVSFTLSGHNGAVECLQLSGDGNTLFSGSWDGTIKVWDLKTRKETRTLRGHLSRIQVLVLSPDGQRLYSGSWDSTIKVWDLATGKVTQTLRGIIGNIESLALSSDGRWLYSGGGNGAIKVWDVEAATEAFTLRGHNTGVISLACSADGKRLFSGSWDKTVRVWDLETKKEVFNLHGHNQGVRSLALSADGKRLFSGSYDLTIKIWDLEVGKEAATLRDHAGGVVSLALSRDGRWLFSGSDDQTIKVWGLDAQAEGYFDVGLALHEQKKMDGAVAAYKKAIELNPKFTLAYNNLKQILIGRGRLEEARVVWEKALALNPPEHDSWFGYAELCLFLGKEDAYRRACRDLLQRFGATTDATIAHRTSRACLLLPTSGGELTNTATLADLGLGKGPLRLAASSRLVGKGLAEYRLDHLDSAVDLMEKVLAGKDSNANKIFQTEARIVLAMAQHRQGKLREARQSLATALGSYNWNQHLELNQNPWDLWINHALRREAELLIVPNLAAFFKGEYQPKNNAQRMQLVPPLRIQRQYLAVARLYIDAFAQVPSLADEMNTNQSRYNAACYAAMAGSGQGRGAEDLNDQERAQWRKRALDWLHADLAVYGTQLEKGDPPTKTLISQRLQYWQKDADLMWVREQDALAKLSTQEQDDWQKLWAGVETLLKKVQE